MGLGRSVATSAGIFRSNNPSRGHQRAGVKTFFPYKTAKTPPIDCSRRADSNKMADGRMRSFLTRALRVVKFYLLALVRCILLKKQAKKAARRLPRGSRGPPSIKLASGGARAAEKISAQKLAKRATNRRPIAIKLREQASTRRRCRIPLNGDIWGHCVSTW